MKRLLVIVTVALAFYIVFPSLGEFQVNSKKESLEVEKFFLHSTLINLPLITVDNNVPVFVRQLEPPLYLARSITENGYIYSVLSENDVGRNCIGYDVIQFLMKEIIDDDWLYLGNYERIEYRIDANKINLETSDAFSQNGINKCLIDFQIINEYRLDNIERLRYYDLSYAIPVPIIGNIYKPIYIPGIFSEQGEESS